MDLKKLYAKKTLLHYWFYAYRIILLACLLAFSAWFTIYLVKGEIERYNTYNAALRLPMPDSVVIDISQFSGILIHESKLDLTGCIIDAGLLELDSIVMLSCNESILTYCYESTQDNSFPRFPIEYSLTFVLYNPDLGVCNRYNKYVTTMSFAYPITEYVRGLPDEIIVNHDSIVIKTRQDVDLVRYYLSMFFRNIFKLFFVFLFVVANWFSFKLFVKAVKGKNKLNADII